MFHFENFLNILCQSENFQRFQKSHLEHGTPADQAKGAKKIRTRNPYFSEYDVLLRGATLNTARRRSSRVLEE